MLASLLPARVDFDGLGMESLPKAMLYVWSSKESDEVLRNAS
jgi:hypothetical protein